MAYATDAPNEAAAAGSPLASIGHNDRGWGLTQNGAAFKETVGRTGAV